MSVAQAGNIMLQRAKEMFRKRNTKTGDLDDAKYTPTRNDYNYDFEKDPMHIMGMTPKADPYADTHAFSHSTLKMMQDKSLGKTK